MCHGIFHWPPTKKAVKRKADPSGNNIFRWVSFVLMDRCMCGFCMNFVTKELETKYDKLIIIFVCLIQSYKWFKIFVCIMQGYKYYYNFIEITAEQEHFGDFISKFISSIEILTTDLIKTFFERSRFKILSKQWNLSFQIPIDNKSNFVESLWPSKFIHVALKGLIYRLDIFKI